MRSHAAALRLALFATACSGGKPTLVLDEETVAERLDRIEEDVPSCHTASSASDTTTMRTAASGLSGILKTVRLIGGPGADYAGVGSTGDCGGRIDVTFEHGNGDTDYTAVLDGYCVSGEEGDVVYDGTILAFEDGTPSDMGPVISGVELATDGAVTMTQGDQTVEVTVSDVKTIYGNPSEFEPGFPEEGSPDQTRIGSVRVVFPDADREDFVENVRIERHGGVDATVTILSGQAGTVGEDRVAVRTAADDPLKVGIYDGTWTGGTLEIEGAKNTLVTVTSRDGAPGVFDLELDGEPYDDAVDCSTAEAPRSTAVWAILQVIPVY